MRQTAPQFLTGMMRHSCWWLLLAVSVFGCKRNDPTVECASCPEQQVIAGAYDPQPYTLEVPDFMPQLPSDDLTVDGVSLGRQLFYDGILSSNGSQSCASCHRQEAAFTDGLTVSVGVQGLSGDRNAMSLANLAFNARGFFWDGRSVSLEAQALVPVEDHRELNENWDNVVGKLRDHPSYPQRFRAAFGIDTKAELTRDLVVNALAQFERTLVSANSKYDRVIYRNQGWLTEEEQRGMELFFFELAQTLDHPGCSHCHNAPLFGDNEFRNNGLDSVGDLNEFADLGLGGFTGRRLDNGKFRTPTLRNIAVTAPYMHDGRFQTLEEVIDQYASGGHGVVNEDANIVPFTLTTADRAALIAFLNTLTDEEFLANPAFSNPF